MIYKNAVKLTMSNFALVSRVFILWLINFAIIFGLSYAFTLPVINLLQSNGWFANLSGYYDTFLQSLNLQTAFSNLGLLMNDFVQILNVNWNSIAFNIYGLVFTLVILGSFLSGLYNVAVSNSLYFSMSNNIKYKFLPSYISTLRLNVKYNLLSLFIKLPAILFIIVIVLYSLNLLFVGGVVTFFAPFIILLIYFVLGSLYMAIFSTWTPSLIIFDNGLFNGLKKAFKITFRKFKKVFANAFYVLLTIFVVNIFSAIVTFGVSLIITIPMSILLVNAFGMVVFYSNYGMRYFVDEFNVIVPAKLESTEPMKNIKFII